MDTLKAENSKSAIIPHFINKSAYLIDAFVSDSEYIYRINRERQICNWNEWKAIKLGNENRKTENLPQQHARFSSSFSAWHINHNK